MTNLDIIRTTINNNFPYLAENYLVDKIGIFGSVARGENKETSDIDIVVEFSNPISLFKFLDLEEYLGRILDKKVDLVTKKGLKPLIKNKILQEVIYV